MTSSDQSSRKPSNTLELPDFFGLVSFVYRGRIFGVSPSTVVDPIVLLRRPDARSLYVSRLVHVNGGDEDFVGRQVAIAGKACEVGSIISTVGIISVSAIAARMGLARFTTRRGLKVNNI